MGYLRFVAVGDSLTEGKGDPYPDGRPRGFADLLATSLAAVDPRATYANLARPSVRTREVLAQQVPAAQRLQPDLVTVVVGPNDVIAVRMDPDAVAAAVDATFAGLAATGATVVTATLPDLGHLTVLATLARRRVQAVNQAVRRGAARHGLVLVDLEREHRPTAAEVALDRVHPSPLGHLELARRVAAAIGVPAPRPTYLAAAPRRAALQRAVRTVAVAPRFLAKRVAREALIASQPPKRGRLDVI